MVYDPTGDNYDNKILDFNQDTAQFYSKSIMYGQLISILIPGNSELEIGLKSQEFIPNLYEEFDEQVMGLFMSPHYNEFDYRRRVCGLASEQSQEHLHKVINEDKRHFSAVKNKEELFRKNAILQTLRNYNFD
uniref:Uncharacterized protein n=1 Tax=Acrobeloides nanus TaxID=290746 RepID=A0A914CBS8_9BILA